MYPSVLNGGWIVFDDLWVKDVADNGTPEELMKSIFLKVEPESLEM